MSLEWKEVFKVPNWSESMQQTFEYYTVDPGTWKDDKIIRNVKSSSITRDSTLETLGSATIDVTDHLGECYVRIYMVTVQNGITERHPLGTFLVQTPSSDFNGKVFSNSMDAYTPLIELKESSPPVGYYVPKETNIMDIVYRLTREYTRAPVVGASLSDTIYSDFVANTDDTWLTFLTDLLSNAKYVFDLDEMGRVLFSPKQELDSLQPVWTYNDDDISILYPDMSVEHDLYGIPNVVEVTYSTGTEYFCSRVVNDDPNSPTSTINRGREIMYRENNPDLVGTPTEEQIEEYAKRLLKSLSSIKYSISYSHSYCPVRVGDCVRINYSRAGINNVKAKVISQSIKCEPGCPVTEKAIFTTNLWG